MASNMSGPSMDSVSGNEMRMTHDDDDALTHVMQ